MSSGSQTVVCLTLVVFWASSGGTRGHQQFQILLFSIRDHYLIFCFSNAFKLAIFLLQIWVTPSLYILL